MKSPRSAPPLSQAGEALLQSLPLPLETRAQIRNAMGRIRALRTAGPSALLSIEPERPMSVMERCRLETALSLYMVVAMQSGSGGLESRVLACEDLFSRNVASPADAVRAGELLLRSRLRSGATDAETFWLAAAFAHPLCPVVDADLHGVAWRYLIHAPFYVDARTARRFAGASLPLRRAPHPRWPLELIASLMERPEQEELGAALAEATLLTSQGARSLSDLPEVFDETDPDALELLQQLATYMLRRRVDSAQARDVVLLASAHAQDPAPYESYLETQRFDLPYEVLYEEVSALLSDLPALDRLYHHYLSAPRLDMARRLLECELVRRLDPWHFGGIYPHIRRALRKVMAGADVSDPRILELASRLSSIHAQTRASTREAVELVRRAAVLSSGTGLGAHLYDFRSEIDRFLHGTSSKTLLAREAQRIEEEWERFDVTEREVLSGTLDWMRRHFHPRLEGLRSLHDAEGHASSIRAMTSGRNPLERAIETLVRLAYFRLFSPSVSAWLMNHVEREIGLSFREVLEADLADIMRLSRRFVVGAGAVAGAGGAFSGFLGGPLGMALDLAQVTVVGVMSTAAIGACFGISPGTERGLSFVVDALTLSCSTEVGDGIVAYLMDQRPRAYRVVASSAILLLARRWLRRGPGVGGLPLRGVRGYLPYVGVTGMALTDRWFLRELTEGALHLAAREWVLGRHGLLVRLESTSP